VNWVYGSCEVLLREFLVSLTVIDECFYMVYILYSWHVRKSCLLISPTNLM